MNETKFTKANEFGESSTRIRLGSKSHPAGCHIGNCLSAPLLETPRHTKFYVNSFRGSGLPLQRCISSCGIYDKTIFCSTSIDSACRWMHFDKLDAPSASFFSRCERLFPLPLPLTCYLYRWFAPFDHSSFSLLFFCWLLTINSGVERQRGKSAGTLSRCHNDARRSKINFLNWLRPFSLSKRN